MHTESSYIDYKLYYDEPNFHGSNNLIQLPKGVWVRSSHTTSGKVVVLSKQDNRSEAEETPTYQRSN